MDSGVKATGFFTFAASGFPWAFMTMLEAQASRTPMRTIRRKKSRTAASLNEMQGITTMCKKIVCFNLFFAFGIAFATAQDIHDHTPAVSGVPQGVPYF